MKRLLKTLFSVLSLVGAMLLITEAVLAGVFYFAGVLTRQKIGDIVKVVRGELESPAEVEAGEEVPRKELEIPGEEELKEAVREWAKEKETQEQALAADREALEAVRRELDTVRVELDARQRRLDENIDAFEAERAAKEAAEKDAGFQEAVKTYAAMEARDVAELLYGLPDGEVVRYLEAFKVAFRAEILTEMMKLDKERQPPGAPGEVRLNRAARLQGIISGGETAPAAE